jgi:hypothetical protein
MMNIPKISVEQSPQPCFTHPMKNHYFGGLSFLCSLLLSPGLIAATLIGLDLEALPEGGISASEIASARTSYSTSAAPFTLRAKTLPKAEVVVESDGRRALRIFAPPPTGEDTLASSLYLGFRDPRLAEFFSPETPVLIQTTLRAGTDQCAIALETIFVKDDVTHAHAVFRTRESKAGAQDQLLDLPAGEIIEVAVALSATGAGVQVTLKAESKGSLLEQREWVIPSEGWGLQDLVIVNLVLHRAGQQLDDSFVDVLAFKVSQ